VYLYTQLLVAWINNLSESRKSAMHKFSYFFVSFFSI
jgi:hypothetical protein